MKNFRQTFIYKNSLSIVFALLFVVSLALQAYAGWREHQDFLLEHQQSPVSFKAYLKTGHFIQATFENWESEFLQMALFIWLTIYLRQKGSSESKKITDDNFEPSELKAKPDSPQAVKKGGFQLQLYKSSLTIAFLTLFVVSFMMHWYGSWLDHSQEETLEGKIPKTFWEFLCESKVWFESWQNWQSEFLAVFSIVFLSIYLRQYGSPQSKPVNAPYGETKG